MGDRANIIVNTSYNDKKPEYVWFYTHWSGSEVPAIVRAALAKQWRWSDPSYLARIIFDQLTRGRQGEETGYGISGSCVDSSYPFLVVDAPTQKVELYGATDEALKRPERIWTFEEFINLPEELTWGNLGQNGDED